MLKKLKIQKSNILVLVKFQQIWSPGVVWNNWWKSKNGNKRTKILSALGGIMFSIKFSFIIIIINSYKKLYYKNYNKILAQESLVSFLSWLIRNRKLCGSGFGSTYSRFRIRIHKTLLYRYVYFRPLPDIPRVPNLRLAGEAFANLLMVFEFLHNFGETLGFGKHFGIFIVICRSL